MTKDEAMQFTCHYCGKQHIIDPNDPQVQRADGSSFAFCDQLILEMKPNYNAIMEVSK